MLPYEIDDALPTAVAKLLWPVKFLKEALGLQNEAQCRDWFAKHPDVLKACLDCHRELEAKIQEIQDKARRGLETYVAQQTLSKYNLQPRAELTIENDQPDMSSAFATSIHAPVSRKRTVEDDTDTTSFAEAVMTLMDEKNQKAFKQIVTTLPPLFAAFITQPPKTKRVKF